MYDAQGQPRVSSAPQAVGSISGLLRQVSKAALQRAAEEQVCALYGALHIWDIAKGTNWVTALGCEKEVGHGAPQAPGTSSA